MLKKAFTGVVTDPIGPSHTISKIKPKPRLHNKDWIEGHETQKQQIALGGSEDLKLLIGDSIIKHMDKASVISKSTWKKMNWINTGLSGDCLENVH